ncbi:unnamed protein product, partial [Effrenium voratum]
VQADALRLSSREACAAAEEMHVELQQIGEAVQSISCEHRELKEEAAIQMRCQHRALSRDIAALERRLSSQTRLAEAAGALQLAAAEENLFAQAEEAAEHAVAGAARTVAERLAEAEKQAPVLGSVGKTPRLCLKRR